MMTPMGYNQVYIGRNVGKRLVDTHVNSTHDVLTWDVCSIVR